jgi:hypothetical protein
MKWILTVALCVLGGAITSSAQAVQFIADQVKLRSLSQRLFEIPLHYRPIEAPLRPG